MDPIRGILFDKDGTLFDFEGTWNVWADMTLRELAENDDDRASALGSLIDFDFKEKRFAADSEAVAGTPEDIAHLLVPGLPEIDPPDLLDRINSSAARVPLIEAVPLGSLIAELRRMGLVLGIATNDAEAPAKAHLITAGIEDEFDYIAGYDSGFGAKPAPGMCLGFVEATGLSSAAVLMVGDSITDLEAGRAAGMRTVAVLTGRASEETLAPLATAVLPDIGHLPNWIAVQG